MSTVKLERWRGHVIAAGKQGMPLSDYAREHGISRYTLYAAQRQLRNEGQLPAKRPVRRALARRSAGPFVAVQVAGAAPAAMRARLPNGVELEFGQLEPRGWATLVGVLAALFR
jgi:hypothetical protein